MNEAGAEAVGPPSKYREAWSQVGDAFGEIGRQFHQDYERVTETADTGTEKSQQSIEQAVTEIRRAVAGTARAIGASLRDPKIRQETEDSGSALLRAVGVSLAELGATLQRGAEHARER